MYKIQPHTNGYFFQHGFYMTFTRDKNVKTIFCPGIMAMGIPEKCRKVGTGRDFEIQDFLS